MPPGQKVPKSHIHSVLRNPVYYGDFIWQGKLFKGSHEPTVSRELWDKVQAILDDRSRPRRKVHSFAFQGLITCGHCGSQYTAELKKGRYVYYHCSRAKGRCPEKYVPESELARQLGEAISQVRLDEEILQWMLKALRESHKDKKEYHDSAVAILEDQQRKLRDRLDAMYVDKLDGKISAEFFEQRSDEWRRELEEIERKRAAHFAADDSYIEEGAKLIELVQRAVILYEKQESHEKRRLLNFVLSNSIWRDGKLQPNYRKPFDSLVLANAETKKARHLLGTEPGKNDIWLGR